MHKEIYSCHGNRHKNETAKDPADPGPERAVSLPTADRLTAACKPSAAQQEKELNATDEQPLLTAKLQHCPSPGFQLVL